MGNKTKVRQERTETRARRKGVSSRSLPEPLSARELEVLHLLAAGRSNMQVASELVISVGTVKTHVNNIFGKLAVHSRTQAVARARKLGILA
ncbi:MAG: response regulator transcription factor [Chloroflexota bacterium]|nr:response regulator transcription factor [Chloroflexota bacterium]